VQISRRALIAISVLLWLIATLCVLAAVILITENVMVRFKGSELHFGYGEHTTSQRPIMFGFLPDNEENDG
jgi:hypothetical protein